jgi:uncharacterized protein YdeI (YjbR/CyaY-like superfamily)
MKTFAATTAADWRAWLADNARREKEVWLIIHHKGSGIPGVLYDEAIEHALCYGWIDSHARKHNADSSLLRFTPRGPRSTWSRLNRERATRMSALGLMTEDGQAVIDRAVANGTWQILADAESVTVPDDLQKLLEDNQAADENFRRFPPSSKRRILEWIASAKRPDTRRRRIDQTVNLAAVNIRANHPGARGVEDGRRTR